MPTGWSFLRSKCRRCRERQHDIYTVYSETYMDVEDRGNITDYQTQSLNYRTGHTVV